MANYLHKGKNQTNILSSLDMGNNNITNLKDLSGPRDGIPKRFLFRRLQRFADKYKLEDLSAVGSENKDAIKAIQEKLKENRMACQVDLHLLRNELKTMSESLKTDIDSNKSEIMKKKKKKKKKNRGDIRQRVESLRGAFEKNSVKKVSNDELQQKLNELNNKFQEDIERSKRMINRNKDEVGEEIMRINEQMRLTEENIESTEQ